MVISLSRTCVVSSATETMIIIEVPPKTRTLNASMFVQERRTGNIAMKERKKEPIRVTLFTTFLT